MDRSFLDFERARDAAHDPVVEEPPPSDDRRRQRHRRAAEGRLAPIGGRRVDGAEGVGEGGGSQLEHQAVVAAGHRMAHAVGPIGGEEDRVTAIGDDRAVPAQVLHEHTRFGEDDAVRVRPFDRRAPSRRRAAVDGAHADDVAVEQDGVGAHASRRWLAAVRRSALQYRRAGGRQLGWDVTGDTAAREAP